MAQLFRDQGRDAWNESKAGACQAVAARAADLVSTSIRERLAL